MPIVIDTSSTASSLSTYSGLSSAIADFLNRDDLTSVIPSFIDLAEARLNRTIRHPKMIETTTLSISGRYVDLPTDFLEARSLVIEDTVPYPAESVSPERSASLRFDRSNTAGKPRYYTIVGDRLDFAPTPDTTYTGTLTYYAKLDALQTANTNWLLDHSPDLYLYTSLIQSAPYLKDDERIMVWAGLANTALEELRLDGDRSQYNASPLMMRPRRAIG